MITIKSKREIELLQVAGNIVYRTHQYRKPYIKEGIKTKEFGIKEKLFKYKYPNLKLEIIIEDKMRGWISFDEYKKLKKKGW